jgi:protein-tyrosine phosphatase
MSHIIKNLYLGNLYDATDDDFINSNDIKHIIRITESDYNLNYNSNLKIHTFKVLDLESEADRYYTILPSIYNIIVNVPENENVLVHCNIGKSRSATAVIYYIMKRYDTKDYNKVLNYVKSKRPIVNQNDGFKKKLKDNENNLI